jgi:hypothetical protein
MHFSPRVCVSSAIGEHETRAQPRELSGSASFLGPQPQLKLLKLNESNLASPHLFELVAA